MGMFDGLANIKKSPKKETIVKHGQKKQNSNVKKRVFKVGTIVMFKDNAHYYFAPASGTKIELLPKLRTLTWKIEKYDENNDQFVYLSYRIQDMYIKARVDQLYIAPREKVSQYGKTFTLDSSPDPTDIEKNNDTSESIRLIDKYVSSIEKVYVYGQPVIQLLHDMITIGQKGYLDRDNLLIWKQLMNIEMSAIAQKDLILNLDIKEELNNFLLNQFAHLKSILDRDFYAKYNFATFIIDWLGRTTFEKESNAYQRVKKLEQDIAQLEDIEKIMEYTNAFIREFDTVSDGEYISIFAKCIDSHMQVPIEDTERFEKESANPVFHSVKKTFTNSLDDIKNKEIGIGTKILSGLNMINLSNYFIDGLYYSEMKRMEIEDLKEISEAKLFLACGYLILRIHALTSDVVSTNVNTEKTEDVFDFDNI